MNIVEIIKDTYPELTDADFVDVIQVRDDSDDLGEYIAKWDYAKPIPEGLKLGKQHNL